MIELDGVEYSVKSAKDNAADMVSAINTFCSENGVVGRSGNILQLNTSFANPMYLIIYGLGYLVSILQRLVYNVGCGYNIANASERQLLNLADTAAMRRRSATRSTLSATIYASSTGDCAITMDLTYSAMAGGNIISFHPAYDVIIPAGEAAPVVMVADVYGPYNTEQNDAAQFDSNPINFLRMYCAPSVPGQEEETIPALRRRMQSRAVNITNLDRAIDAVGSLEGVSVCNIVFNHTTVDSMIVGGITIPPRKALLIVQGYSNKIAQTFFEYMACETAGADSSRAITQTYITYSHQNIPVTFVSPRTVDVIIRVYVGKTTSDAESDRIKTAILNLGGTLLIGQPLTSNQVLNAAEVALPSLELQGCLISDNEMMEGSYRYEPEGDQLITIRLSNVRVVSV